MIVPALDPGTRVRQYGPFSLFAYVHTHDYVSPSGHRTPMWLYVGSAWRWGRAQRMANQELAKRLTTTEEPKP